MASKARKLYSQSDKEEAVERICVLMEEEKLSLSKVLEREKDLPRMSTVFGWLSDDADLAERYACARAALIEKLLDETIDIAEEATDDVYIETGKDGQRYAKIDGSCLKRAALRINTRERYAQLVMPEKYSTQRMDVTSKGKALVAPTGADSRLDAILALALSRKQQPTAAPELIDITPEPSLDDIMG